jgi:3-hydroxyisobutyrate dehydrogenase-like beta-hydroxyacid dehydrogenase
MAWMSNYTTPTALGIDHRQPTNSSRDLPSLTVIGLGPMGRAMVTTLMKAGHPVTVWNRTSSRAAELVKAGATLAPAPADAVMASKLIILSLTDYQAMYDIFSGASGVLAGKVLVNLSSDTPDASRKAAAWAAEHGASFLTGGVMVPAPMVGSEAAYVYYSGPESLFREHEALLRLLGAPRYVGQDPGLAQLWYQAQLTVFLTALSGLLQAAALVSAEGVPVGSFLPEALNTFTDIPVMLDGGHELAKSLETGVHPGDLSTVLMMGATADHILRTSDALGIDIRMPEALKSHYDRAIAAGHGTHNWTALYEVIKSRR